jgi:RNA polymerase sigma factor (sigma-70 family)
MLTAAQQIVVEKYHYEIYAFLSKYSLPVNEFYDLAAIGLCKAAQSYDATKKCSFFAFAWLCMIGEIKMEYRRKRSRINALSMETTGKGDDSTTLLNETVSDPEQADQISDIEALEIISKLEPTEQRAVWLTIHNMSLSECTGIMQLTPITYCTIRETAFAKLQNYLATGKIKPLDAAQLAQVKADALKKCRAEEKRERDLSKINVSTSSGLYYRNHLEERRAANLSYYHAHREEINAKKRILRAERCKGQHRRGTKKGKY